MKVLKKAKIAKASGGDKGQKVTRLEDIETDKVDLVTAAANRKKFAIIKNEDGKQKVQGSDKVLKAALLFDDAKTSEEAKKASMDLIKTVCEVSNVDISELIKSDENKSPKWMQSMKDLFETMSGQLKELKEQKTSNNDNEQWEQFFKSAGVEGGAKELVDRVKALEETSSALTVVPGLVTGLVKEIQKAQKRIYNLEGEPVKKHSSFNEVTPDGESFDNIDISGDLTRIAANSRK